MLHDIRWTHDKLLQRLQLIEPLVYHRRLPLPPFSFKPVGSGPRPELPTTYPPQGWEFIPWESYWGAYDVNFLLHTEFRVPSEWIDQNNVCLYLPIGNANNFSHPEALALIDGEPFAACDRHHREIRLPKSCMDGKAHMLTLWGWTGRLEGGLNAKLYMDTCSLVQVHQATRDFIATARVALGVVKQLKQHDPVRANLLNSLDEAFKALDTRDPLDDRFYASVEEAHQILRDGIEQSGPPMNVNVYATGHAHIDVAWLWPLKQTRNKTLRTFLNVLGLMADHPEFRFTQSQPQLYEFIQEDHPELFEAIRDRVDDGRWEPIGGMWVEADCNLSGGESLARQLLYGRSFYHQHFGTDSPILWLPDVFGYAWNLPQLIKEAGLEYFFTIKLGWNQYNRLPYDSFWWQGIDGTKVLTHFSTTHESGSEMISTYNAKATPEEIIYTWTNFQQKDWGTPGLLPPLLMSFGYGNGGGGPTREMIENIQEMSQFPGAPQVHFSTAQDFFRKLEQDLGERLPTWSGELYLEYHRGTYTSQARNKRANRKSEFLLHDAEFLASVAGVLNPDSTYPDQDLTQAWKLVCLNQFHDILPGSSIGEVYEESLQQYSKVEMIAERVIEDALSLISNYVSGDILIVNPTSFSRSDIAFLPDKNHGATSLQHKDGSEVLLQQTNGGYLIGAGNLPPYSVTGLISSSHQANPSVNQSNLIATPGLLENELLRIELDQNGDIIRIYDKEYDREVLPLGALANQFQAFEDRPRTPDAWEIDIYYDDKIWYADPPTSVEVIETGPLRATIQIHRRILSSEISQRISILRNSRRIDFDTTINWCEQHTLLKVAFPVNVLSPKATYEIQWGNVERPTHRNTSWDWARFETCAQKWVDLSEGGYGVSLLNDSKYGHDILGNVMRLSLLRGPTHPDPNADQGEHRFVYSLLPHSGGWDTSTISEAYALNDPLIAFKAPSDNISPENSSETGIHTKGSWSFLQVDQPNVVVETIKKAEDGRGLIVRMYESKRHRGSCNLRFGFPINKVWRTNLIEEDLEAISVKEAAVCIECNPYQIITLRIIPA